MTIARHIIFMDFSFGLNEIKTITTQKQQLLYNNNAYRAGVVCSGAGVYIELVGNFNEKQIGRERKRGVREGGRETTTRRRRRRVEIKPHP